MATDKREEAFKRVVYIGEHPATHRLGFNAGWAAIEARAVAAERRLDEAEKLLHGYVVDNEKASDEVVALEQRVAELEQAADGHRQGAANLEDLLETAEAERDALKGALETLANPNPDEWTANGYVRRMAKFARGALAASVSKEEAR